MHDDRNVSYQPEMKHHITMQTDDLGCNELSGDLKYYLYSCLQKQDDENNKSRKLSKR